MTVKFKFDYVLDLHNRQSYITAIERDGVEEEMAYKRSLVQINKGDIKSITKTKDGAATIIRKSINPPLTTIEDYDEILDAIQNANLALEMRASNFSLYSFNTNGLRSATRPARSCNPATFSRKFSSI